MRLSARMRRPPHKNNNHESRWRRDAKPGEGFALMNPHQLSAVELLAAYRAHKISPLEVMKDVLDRVARFEPHIKATYRLDPERALAEAKVSEQRWMRDAPLGPLDGAPTTVKDNIATKGDPLPLGTAASDL